MKDSAGNTIVVGNYVTFAEAYIAAGDGEVDLFVRPHLKIGKVEALITDSECPKVKIVVFGSEDDFTELSPDGVLCIYNCDLSDDIVYKHNKKQDR